MASIDGKHSQWLERAYTQAKTAHEQELESERRYDRLIAASEQEA